MKVKEILPQHPVNIAVRINAPENCGYKDLLFGHCKWDGKDLISLDGDTYSIEDEICRCEYETDGSLTYWISAEWE